MSAKVAKVECFPCGDTGVARRIPVGPRPCSEYTLVPCTGPIGRVFAATQRREVAG